jgi:hypothetical protein
MEAMFYLRRRCLIKPAITGFRVNRLRYGLGHDKDHTFLTATGKEKES